MTPTSVRFGLVLAILIAICDQSIKWWVVNVIMRPPQFIPVTDFFNLVLAYNRGVSFGMFDTQSPIGRWVLTALSLTITFGLLVWMWRAEKKLIVVALGLIVGGALGNVMDRLMLGAVVDFLDFHVAGYHWPAFNLADTSITCGAAVIIADSFLSTRQES